MVAVIELPKLYVITAPTNEIEFFNRLEQVLACGIKLIQLRLPGFNVNQYSIFAERAIKLCRNSNTLLLLNCDPYLARELNADGVHLNAKYLEILNNRPLKNNYLVAASSHNRNELIKACQLQLDFVVLSPVLATNSHQNAIPLGWKNFNELINNIDIPVYALGGMNIIHLSIARYYGAQGIAAISGLWNNYHSIKEGILS